MNFINDLLITMVIYMLYPFIKFKLLDNNIEYTKTQINKTCIINSIVCAIISLIIGVNFIENYEPNFVPAFAWYCINYTIFTYTSNKSIFKITTKDKDLKELDLQLILKMSIITIIIVSIVIYVYASIFELI